MKNRLLTSNVLKLLVHDVIESILPVLRERVIQVPHLTKKDAVEEGRAVINELFYDSR